MLWPGLSLMTRIALTTPHTRPIRAVERRPGSAPSLSHCFLLVAIDHANQQVRRSTSPPTASTPRTTPRNIGVIAGGRERSDESPWELRPLPLWWGVAPGGK